MTFALVAAGSVLVVLLTFLWAKEFRLRRALQALLAEIFNQWRNGDDANDSPPQGRDHRGRDAADRRRGMR
jgi:hypothetical protein